MDLSFSDREFFKIAQLTDLHLTHLRDDGPEQKTLSLIEEIAENEKPDLFAVTGDLVMSASAAQTLKDFCDFMDKRKLLWAFTFGNHDREFGEAAPVLEKVLSEAEYCIYERGDESVAGDGNYTINLYAGKNRLTWVLYMLDSGDYLRRKGKETYAYIDHSQIKWVRESRIRSNTKSGGIPYALFFFHIPLPEYNEVWNEKLCFGQKNEGVCSPVYNSGLFCTLVEDGYVKGVFAGHDHTNDYIGELFGVRLAYGRVTGYTDQAGRGAYGPDDFRRGARIIVLPAKWRQNFETYLYLEGGERVTEQPGHRPEQKA